MKAVFLEAGHWHLPCYLRPMLEWGHEAVLFDQNEQRLKELAEKFEVEHCADYAKLGEIGADFAFTFGSHDEMPKIIDMCIKNHIPFMAEKPGAIKAETLANLAKRCDEEKLFHAAPFSMRWDDAAIKAKEILDNDVLGRIARLNLTYFAGPASRYPNWKCAWVLDKNKAGGGWLYNLGVHLVDLLYYWGFNAEFINGTMSSALNQGEIEDVSSILVKTGSDSYAVVEGGYCAKSMYGGYSFSIIGEKGYLEFSYGTLTLNGPDDKEEKFDLPMKDSRGEMMKILLDCCQNGKKPPIDLHDIVKTVKVVEDFYGSVD